LQSLFECVETVEWGDLWIEQVKHRQERLLIVEHWFRAVSKGA